MIWTNWQGSLQVTEIGRDRFDLGLVQAMRNRLHNGGGIRLSGILTPLLAPVRQFLEDIVRELTCQTRKLPVAFCLLAVTRSARRNIGIGDSFFEDLFSRGHEVLLAAAEGFRIELVKIRGERRLHLRAQNMRYVEH